VKGDIPRLGRRALSPMRDRGPDSTFLRHRLQNPFRGRWAQGRRCIEDHVVKKQPKETITSGRIVSPIWFWRHDEREAL